MVPFSRSVRSSRHFGALGRVTPDVKPAVSRRENRRVELTERAVLALGARCANRFDSTAISIERAFDAVARDCAMRATPRRPRRAGSPMSSCSAPQRFRASAPWYLASTMARQVDDPSEAQASKEIAGETSDGDDDDGDWPTLFELDLKLSLLMGQAASNEARRRDTRTAT